MKIVLAVPFRAAANANGASCLALAPLAGTTPLGIMAGRFPDLERYVAASSFKLTDEISARIRKAGFKVVEGDDLDLLGRLLAVADASGAEVILRVPVESIWLDASILDGEVAAGAAAVGLAAELLPVADLRRIATRSPVGLDRERPQRLFAPAPPPRIDAARIALETEADLEDAAELIKSGVLEPTSAPAEVVAAYRALDERRADARQPLTGSPQGDLLVAGGRVGTSLFGGDRISQIAEGTACPPGAAPSARSRKVVFVSGISYYGGAEEFLRETIAWTRVIAEVEVILPGPGPLGERLKADGTPHRFLAVPARRFSPPGRFGRDIDCLRDAVAGAGLVVAKNFYAPEAAVPAARGAGVPVWTHLHAILEPAMIERLKIGESDLVIGDSHAVIASVPAGLGVVLPNGVDLDFWLPDADRSAGRPRILLAARTESHKGHEVFIAAAEKLAREGLDFELAIVGAATDPRSASFAEKIRERLKSGPLADRHILRGWSDDLREEMRQADILVIPTLPPGEPFGRVGIYAMAMGLPVVASDLGGPRDYVRDGETGRLAAPGDPEALAEALRPLVAESTLRLEMARKAREAVKAFDIRDISRRWREMVMAVLES